ncbi:MAG: hypothetical protein HON68_00435 [Gammaproteobacteria bacterium]|jgi:hypothetical protein|nr:hypothetical protein [Gammaproteobacteria bacterium]MBT3718018.1 hypothetical protein [Gammaproteobacteria bacterium]MBT3843642.1 hypothetical protein [Gammaproteobacteria bacterium]MBT3893966.1 hypothetical protein [Gammaproteobacteria bacterium]MBT4301915.1 hypothetical protein [Gammaproteobacteria bacterium]
MSDVASKHYDRYDYLSEKRAGLERWACELMRIIGEELEGNVVKLRG